MSNSPAPIIAFEGIDGSGKGTQSRLLVDHLNSTGVNAKLLSFPRYDDTFFGARIGDFLNGKFGSLAELDPFLISLLYAGDRFESKGAIETLQAETDVIVCDRYVPSNIAHQTAKLPKEKRHELTQWIEHIEFSIFNLPRPDIVMLLDTPVDVSQKLIAMKEKRTYTDEAADLQEEDTAYLSIVRDVYLDLASTNSNWRTISLTENGELLSVEQVAQSVQQYAGEFLSSPTS